jgi:predicted nucleic acid-binding protein
MNGNNILADTNILIYLLSSDDELIMVLENKSVYISFISELELLSFKNYTASEKTKMESMLNDCIIIDINPEIKKFAVHQRVKNNLKLPDAIVAATAQYLSIPLLTADLDFGKIKEIDVLLYRK